jgi:hypothetical protein
MELTREERELVENYRSLGLEGRKELLDRAAAMAARTQEEKGPKQCAVPEKGEKRPEAAEEPIFTE